MGNILKETEPVTASQLKYLKYEDKNMTRIASVSMTVTCDVKSNMKKHVQFIERAAAEKVDLLCFPENSLQGFEPSMDTFESDAAEYVHRTAELVPEGKSVQTIIELAKKYKMYITFGMTEQDPYYSDRLWNSMVLVGPEGYIDTFRKVHLPGTEKLYRWSAEEFKVVDTPVGRIGGCICYDKCFPEAARTLALKGAEIIISPTAWPAGSLEEDDPSLMQYKNIGYVRAVENQLFWIDANCYTPDAVEVECGHSRIVAPDGEVLATTLFEENMAIADVDVKEGIRKARSLVWHGGANFMKERFPKAYELD